jgi:hypothetical protein
MAGKDDVNANCSAIDLACTTSEGFINTLYHGVMDAIGETAKGLGSFWVHTPSVPLEGPDNAVTFMRDTTLWYVGVLMMISVFYAAGQMIWNRKGQPLTDLLASLLKYILVSAASVSAITMLLHAGDEFSAWVIDQSTGAEFGAALTGLMALTAFTSVTIGPGLAIFIIVVGIIAILISVIQIGLLIIRSAMAIILVGTLPMAYSATNTQWGKQWSQKHTSWLIAFIAYKPVASLIYAAAFKIFGTFGSTNGDLGQRIVYFCSGIVLMVASLLALPAMMRLIVPAVGAASAGGSMFAGAVVGGAASGAVNFGSRMAARGGGAGGGAAGASGAGGGGAATGAAAAKGAGAAAAGAATGGAGLALMAVGAAAKKSKEGAHALQSAVHDAAGEQAPPAPKESKGGGGVLPPLRGSRSRGSGSRTPAPSHDDSGSAPRPNKKQEKR